MCVEYYLESGAGTFTFFQRYKMLGMRGLSGKLICYFVVTMVVKNTKNTCECRLGSDSLFKGMQDYKLLKFYNVVIFPYHLLNL